MTESVKATQIAPEEITKKDVTKAYLRWHFANEIPHSFERYLAPSLLYAMMPILRKLYKNEDALKAAYKRQLLFFNTQLSWGGGVITGLMSSMEQQRAEEEHENKEVLMQDDLMYNTKAGLMGALAGIGDAIDSGTVQYIFIAIAVPWAQQARCIVPICLFRFIPSIFRCIFCSTSFCNGTKRDRIDAKHRCSDSNRNVVCSRVVYDGGLSWKLCQCFFFAEI